jgi:hypothetical protein
MGVFMKEFSYMDKQTIEETMVGNRTIKLVHDDVPIELVELDFENPRIKYKLSLQGTNGDAPTEKDLEQIILNLPDVRKLQRDIEHNGGLRERVILQKTGNGKYVAVEGNVRTVVIRDIAKKNKAATWKKIPAKILPDDVDPKQVAIMLTDFHVRGKLKWGAHEKAGQIYRMARELGMSQEDIATYHHSSKGTINRILVAYGFFIDTFLTLDKGAYGKDQKAEGKWSYFDEFFKKKELRERLAGDTQFGEQFCRWVGEGKLPQPVNVRKLPDILRNDEARKKLENGGTFAEAMKIVDASDPAQGSDFFRLLAKMKEALTDNTQIKEILRIRTDAVARKRLVETHDAMVDFMLLADVEISKTTPK